MSHLDLPPEILDSVVDLLSNKPETLRQCCLVSKSWVPRARKHLFAVIVFRTEGCLNAWKKTFPDPSDSPAHHTHDLTIKFLGVITEDGCIPTFPRLARLKVVETPGLGCRHMNPAAFQEFPHTLKSLSVTSFSLTLSQVFSLIRSIPFLEDLSLTGRAADINYNDQDGLRIVAPPPTSPPFTGALGLSMFRGTTDAAQRLLNLPNGLRFRKLQLQRCSRGDLHYVMELVTACSDTLECLDITCPPEGAIHFCQTRHLLTSRSTDRSVPIQIDLSKAMKLQHIIFRCGSLRIEWITRTLETITPENQGFQRITVDVDRVRILVGVDPGVGWPDLDHLLVRFWESRSIRTTLESFGRPLRGMMDFAMCLLPELTKRGAIDLVEEPMFYV